MRQFFRNFIGNLYFVFLGLNYLIFFFEEEFLEFVDFLSKVVVYYNVKVYIVIVYVSCIGQYYWVKIFIFLLLLKDNNLEVFL